MNFKVKKSDLKGEISEFPIEVVQKMCEHQVAQGNKFDPSIFQKDCLAGVHVKGFSWSDTPEYKQNVSFWREVIGVKKFQLFFKYYPKKKTIKLFDSKGNIYEAVLVKKAKPLPYSKWYIKNSEHPNISNSINFDEIIEEYVKYYASFE